MASSVLVKAGGGCQRRHTSQGISRFFIHNRAWWHQFSIEFGSEFGSEFSSESSSELANER